MKPIEEQDYEYVLVVDKEKNSKFGLEKLLHDSGIYAVKHNSYNPKLVHIALSLPEKEYQSQAEALGLAIRVKNHLLPIEYKKVFKNEYLPFPMYTKHSILLRLLGKRIDCDG